MIATPTESGGPHTTIRRAAFGALACSIAFAALAFAWPFLARPSIAGPILQLLWFVPFLFFALALHARRMFGGATPAAGVTIATLAVELTSLWMILLAQATESSPLNEVAGIVWYVERFVLLAWAIWMRVRLGRTGIGAGVKISASGAAILLAFSAFQPPVAAQARALALILLFFALSFAARRPESWPALTAAISGGSGSQRWMPAFALAAVAAVPMATMLSIHAATAAPEHLQENAALILVLARNAQDPRIDLVRDGVAHWNAELARLESTFRLSAPTHAGAVIADADRAQLEIMSSTVPRAVEQRVASLPGDVIVLLSDERLMSFVHSERIAGKTIVVITSSYGAPDQRNIVRNVIAHEMGHAIGLRHNSEPGSLMCGRPAPCRPELYRSEREHYFRLTPEDESRLLALYP